MSRRLILLSLSLLVALGAGIVSLRDVDAQLAVIDACDAVAAGDYATALSRTEGLVGGDAIGRSAAECRCHAQLATGAGEACVDTLTELLERGAPDDWAPAPQLSIHLVQTLRDRGRAAAAAQVAARAARAYPRDPDLFYLELATRSSIGEEREALRDLTPRIAASGPEAARMRVTLANRHLMRGDAPAALDVLGPAPPPESGEATGLWFETRGMAHAADADLAGVNATYARWRAAGGQRRELDARYALTLSIGKIDGREPTLTLLERAVAAGPYDDAKLEELLIVRLVLALALNGHSEAAIAAYDRGRQRFALEGLTRDELARSARQRDAAEAGGAATPGVLAFTSASAPPDASLWVSPPQDAALDAPFALAPRAASGAWSVTRTPGDAPARWVLRSAEGTILGSGTLAPQAGRTRAVEIAARTGRAPDSARLVRAPADGRRRVAAVLLDCGDWRITQYLRARGELPVLDRLLLGGHRAVLDSDPPLTAAALEALVWPARSTSPSFLGWVHRLGLELAGLSSIGDNPFEPLSWVLPEVPDLFEVVGSGDLQAANLLFAHGGIAAGRHGEITGPHGHTRQAALGAAARDLDADERARFPQLAAVRKESDAIHLRTIAAEFDSAEDLVRAGEIDLLMLRVEALDILTHGHFARSVRDGQDDGEGLLFEVYRYIDSRLGELHDALDEDDVLVVFSDHGIRTSMEHAREAMFVADGAGIAPGRSPGTPALRGVAHALSNLLGIAHEWPDTGVMPGSRTVATHR